MNRVFPTFLRDTVLSIVLAFGLSTAFWAIWDIFVLSGFVAFSVESGVLGALAACGLRRGLPTALVATAAIRVLVFVALSEIWT
ncbi:MAG: hypothetical protein EA426_03580 [Spirochaetaceae bacterium]|nr:MAG: hypothetical protein EA426_03580 [Spirochaetaceae bacterium]